MRKIRWGVLSTDAEYNQAGRLSYRIVTDGRAVTRYVDVPQNYSLEVEQLGRCIASGETPHVSAQFSLSVARALDSALASIGYESSEYKGDLRHDYRNRTQRRHS